MSDLDLIRQHHPDAYAQFDQAAWDCGYPKPWQVWSHWDQDMKLLGEGTTEPEAWQDAQRHLDA